MVAPALHCVIVSHHVYGSTNEQNATTDKIVSVVHGNRDLDLIRFLAKIKIFDFESNYIVTISVYSSIDTVQSYAKSS